MEWRILQDANVRSRASSLSNFLKLSRGVRTVFKKLLGRVKLRRPLDNLDPAQDRLRVSIDQNFSEPICVGGGTTLAISGSCFHPRSRIVRLEMSINGCTSPVDLHSLKNNRLRRTTPAAQDPRGRSRWSGFAAIVTIPGIDSAVEDHLVARAYLADGTQHEAIGGTLKLTANCEHFVATPTEIPDRLDTQPLIGICMATYNPPRDLFVRQIESIRSQTHTNWICIICDDCSDESIYREMIRELHGDSRFQIHRNLRNLGFYHNFEKCVSLVPPEVDYVGLSDQDDFWHPDKLASLLAAFDETTTLVYSDMNLVDPTGRVLKSSYWGTRLNQFERLDLLLIANTVTGAASLLRRRLLDDILPFPTKQMDAYHDHWMGCVALALGKIGYVDRPLYDYVQHGNNVIGHCPGKPKTVRAKVLRCLSLFLPWNFHARLRSFLEDSHRYAKKSMIYVIRVSRALEIRMKERMTPEKAKQVQRLSILPGSLRGMFGMLYLILRRPSGVTETAGEDTVLFRAILWCKAARFKSWLLSRWSMKIRRSAARRERMSRLN